MIKMCVICGEDFETTPRGTNAMVCSYECRLIRNRNVAREKKRNASPSRRAKKSLQGFAKINEEARKMGLSYGQYVGLYMNGGNEK